MVELPGRETAGQFLGALPIADAEEGVVPGREPDAFGG
jgi:hypothetical protein